MNTVPEVASEGIVDELPPPPDLLLSVPFYVYEEISWINATINGEPPLEEFNLHYAFNGSLRFKNGDDYFFLKAAMSHPMRTRNIDEAKLFFVPTLLNQYDFFVNLWRFNKQFCVNGKCHLDLLEHTHKVLEKSKAFKLYPQRHIIVRSHWGTNIANRKNEKEERYSKFFLNTVPQMSRVTFESERVEFKPYPFPKYTLSSYKVGSPCPEGIIEEKTLDFVMIANMKFAHRRDLCNWLKEAESTMNVTSICGTGNRCPALAQAKFGIHTKGDSPGSQRLMDTILSGTVPIFTHISQFDVQGSWIDWKQLAYYVPIHNVSAKSKTKKIGRFAIHDNEAVQDNFLSRIARILNDTAGYERKRQAILDHIPFFDMTTIYPFDTYMYLFQAELYPETRHARSRWSALILPPVLYNDP